MKLSEAIRLGSMLGPQLQGRTYGEHNNGTCALGAALLAIGITRESYSVALTYFPVTSYRVRLVDAPVHIESDDASVCALTVIRTLNDEYHWTREQIAAWVETIEPQTVAEVVGCNTAGSSV